ncbi:MAG: type II secretion system protein N [Planctomycetota bacterium]|jgi:type II secretion system protein C
MKRGYELYIRKILLASKLAMVIVLGFLIGTAVMTITKSTEVFTPASLSAENFSDIENPIRSTISPENYSDIVEQNIFSGAAGSSDPDSLIGGNTPNSMKSAGKELGLALVGVVAGSPMYSKAVIKNISTNVQKTYKIGDKVATAIIDSIEENKIVLLRNGEQMVLHMSFASDEQVKQQDNQKLPKQRIAESVKADQKKSSPHEIAKTGFGQIETILKEAVIKPHLVNGKIQGLRIDGLEKLKGARAMGLKNGDVVRSVNGHLLTSKQKAFQVFKKSRSQPTIDIELLRDEKTKILSFDLK